MILLEVITKIVEEEVKLLLLLLLFLVNVARITTVGMNIFATTRSRKCLNPEGSWVKKGKSGMRGKELQIQIQQRLLQSYHPFSSLALFLQHLVLSPREMNSVA